MQKQTGTIWSAVVGPVTRASEPRDQPRDAHADERERGNPRSDRRAPVRSRWAACANGQFRLRPASATVRPSPPSSSAEARQRPMEIHLDDPRHTGDLVAFLQRARCAIERLEDGGLLVRMPGSTLPDAERLELKLYLQTWCALHPGAQVRIDSTSPHRTA